MLRRLVRTHCILFFSLWDNQHDGDFTYHVSRRPLRIFWNDDTTCPIRVPRMLSITGWNSRNPACSRQHAWHSCRAGCIVISENPQGLATDMVQPRKQIDDKRISRLNKKYGLSIHPTVYLKYIPAFQRALKSPPYTCVPSVEVS